MDPMICFRIRFRLGARVTIASSAKHLIIDDPFEGKEIRLKPPGKDTPFKDATDLVLRGRPFDTKADAEEAAHRWKGILQKAFSRVNIAADFGGRAPTSAFTTHGLKMLEGDTGQRVLNDVHGISVFECEPPPRFAKMEIGGISVGRNTDRLVAALAAAVERGLAMGAREGLAYDLYSASFSESSADARLAMLMMAVETLIQPEPRPAAVREHVDRLITETRGSELPQAEIDSIIGTLRWVREESIGQAGRKLVSRLGDRKYMNELPDEFFTNCYILRSRLFHGHVPRPTREEVDGRAAPLEQFVSDLLSLELLDLF
jgi:hypothetical protein